MNSYVGKGPFKAWNSLDDYLLQGILAPRLLIVFNYVSLFLLDLSLLPINFSLPSSLYPLMLPTPPSPPFPYISQAPTSFSLPSLSLISLAPIALSLLLLPPVFLLDISSTLPILPLYLSFSSHPMSPTTPSLSISQASTLCSPFIVNNLFICAGREKLIAHLVDF